MKIVPVYFTTGDDLEALIIEAWQIKQRSFGYSLYSHIAEDYSIQREYNFTVRPLTVNEQDRLETYEKGLVFEETGEYFGYYHMSIDITLNVLCHFGFIPEGRYIIETRWNI